MKVLVNKNKNAKPKTQKVPGLKIDYSLLSENIIKKEKLSFSELTPKEPTSLDRQQAQKTDEDIIQEFLAQYEIVREKMNDEEIFNHYNRVKLDVPQKFLFETQQSNNDTKIDQNKKKKKALKLSFSQGVSITNSTKTNGYNFPLFTKNSTPHSPRTFTTLIMPNTQLQTAKRLFRLFARVRKTDYSFIGMVETNATWEEQTSNHTIGFEVFILPNNKIKLSYGYIVGSYQEVTFETLTFDTLSITSENELKIREWNNIAFGIDNDRRLFIKINDSNISRSNTPLPENAVDINSFLNNFVLEDGKTVYDKVTRTASVSSVLEVSKTFTGLELLGTFNFENFYWDFPQFLIGGVETRDSSTHIGKLLSNENIPNDIKKLHRAWYILNGAYDFDIISLRHYTKVLSENELEFDKITADLKNDNYELYSNCTLDLQFDSLINQNKNIEDLSKMGNHGVLVGDMKLSISEETNSYFVIQELLPELIDKEGPF